MTVSSSRFHHWPRAPAAPPPPLLSHAPHFLPSPRLSHRSLMSVTPDRGSPSSPGSTETRARTFSQARELGKGPAIYRGRVGWLPSSTKKKREFSAKTWLVARAACFHLGFPPVWCPQDSPPCACKCRSCCCKFVCSQTSALGPAGSCHQLSTGDWSLFSLGRAELQVSWSFPRLGGCSVLRLIWCPEMEWCPSRPPASPRCLVQGLLAQQVVAPAFLYYQT